MRRSLLAPIVGLALGLAACTDAAPPSPCEPDVGYFEAKVWPVVGRICVACHVAGGAAASSDFVLAPASATGSTMAANLAAARRMALATEAGEPLLLRRPVGTGHPGGMVISPGSAEHRALADFAARVRGDVGACDAPTCRQGDPGPRLLRRLSRAEYDATLRALFGVDARYAGQGNEITIWVGEGAAWPGDDRSVRERFDDDYRRIYGLTIPDVPIEALFTTPAVDSFLRRVMRLATIS